MHGAPRIKDLLVPLQCITCRKKSQVTLNHLRHTVWDPLPPTPLTPLPLQLPLPPHVRIWPSMSKMAHCLRVFTGQCNLFNVQICTRTYNNRNNNGLPAGRRPSTPLYSPPPGLVMSYILPPPGLPGVISIWTDGSAHDNGLETCTAGAAWTTEFYIDGYYKLTGYPLSNNVAEVAAVILALSSWRGYDVHIFTDSTFVLGLINGGLLAMERDGWPDLPWLHAITPLRSYSTIFQHLLYLLHAHNGLLDFSKVKAHDDCNGNNRADRLANTGRISGYTFDLSLLHTPSNWVNTSLVLNNSSIAALSISAVNI